MNYPNGSTRREPKLTTDSPMKRAILAGVGGDTVAHRTSTLASAAACFRSGSSTPLISLSPGLGPGLFSCLARFRQRGASPRQRRHAHRQIRRRVLRPLVHLRRHRDGSVCVVGRGPVWPGPGDCLFQADRRYAFDVSLGSCVTSTAGPNGDAQLYER
jgi:hypothetical protein